MPDLEPITVTLRRLAAAGGLTYRALAHRTHELDSQGRGVTNSYISGLGSGKEQPSARSLELIARARSP
jgi:transcriptional regulator with XRE-family HTH domain